MRAGGKQGRERTSVAGATRCLTHFSGLGAEPGSLWPLLRSPGAVSPLSPAATAETPLCRLLGTGVCMATGDTGPGSRCGSGQRQHCGIAASTAGVWPCRVPCPSHWVQPTDAFVPCTARALAMHTRAAVPVQGHVPGGRGDSGWSARLRAAAAMPIVNGGLAATALSPAPQGEAY